MTAELIVFMDIIIEKNRDAYRRLMIELLVSIYNDILGVEDYRFAVYRWLKYEDKYYKKKLREHFDSIDILRNQMIGSICFQYLNLEGINRKDIEKSINGKINSEYKYRKFFTDFARECGHDTKAIQSQRNRRNDEVAAKPKSNGQRKRTKQMGKVQANKRKL